MTTGSSSVFRLKRGMGMRDAGRRGRGVRLRGGSRMQRRGDDSEESDEDDDDDDDEEEEEEEEEDSEEGGRERRHRQRRRRRRTDDDEDEDEDSEGQEFDPEDEEMDTLEDEEDEEEMEEEEGRWDSDPEPPVLLVSDLNDDLLSGSYLTVTLQHPHKAKRQSGKTSCGDSDRVRVLLLKSQNERVQLKDVSSLLRLHSPKAGSSHGSEDSCRRWWSAGLHPEKDGPVQTCTAQVW